jgi:hemerythrin
MQSIRYPEIEAQKTAHKKFIADLAKLKMEYQTSGGNISLIINANQMIIDWLTKHISNMDKKIGAYAKTMK